MYDENSVSKSYSGSINRLSGKRLLKDNLNIVQFKL